MDEDEYGYGDRPSMTLWKVMKLLDVEWLVIPIVLLVLIALGGTYLLARSRANREAVPDPQLGLKFALGYFRTTSYHLLLVGTVMLAFAIIMRGPSSGKEDLYRQSFALIVPAALLFGVHAWALTRTNQAEHPNVGRIFAGFSLLLSGVLGTAALIRVFQLLFQKGSSGNDGRFFWALFLVYGTAWVVQGIRFYRRVQTEPMTAIAAFYPPPPAQPPMPGQLVIPAAPGMPATPAPVQVPLPAPMAMPLAPPGSGPGGGPSGTTL